LTVSSGTSAGDVEEHVDEQFAPFAAQRHWERVDVRQGLQAFVLGQVGRGLFAMSSQARRIIV
jgi:hypothetical protein